MNKFVKVLINGVIFAGGFALGAYLMHEKDKKEMDGIIETEVNDIREHYRKKSEELEETEEKIKKARYQELIENYKEKAKDPEEKKDKYPETVEEIEEYNFDNKLYQELEYITEEDFKYDSDAIADKVECRMYNDGSVYTTSGTLVTDESLGNLCSGMGTDDCLRYIRNWEEKVDYCVEYFDEEPREDEE